jgi:magnesium chelatase family protein
LICELATEPVGALPAAAGGERSSVVAGRVASARERQRRRLRGTPAFCNAAMTGPMTRGQVVVDRQARQLLRAVDTRSPLSGRGHDRVLRLARTIADLEGEDRVRAHHLAEALAFRLTGVGATA